MSFSPDDRFIAAGVGKKVEVWRTPGRRHQIAPLSLLRSYGGLQDDVTCLAWGPDSRHLVAGKVTSRLSSAGWCGMHEFSHQDEKER